MYVIVEILTEAYIVLSSYFLLERIHHPLPSEQGLKAIQMSKVSEGLYQIKPLQVLSKR